VQSIIDLLVNLHWGAVGQIILIDLLLGGDNAVVIALACRDLPHNLRLKGIVLGTAGAIILRVILITCAVALLDLPFLKVVGGALLIWIGVKLLLPETESAEEKIASSTKLFAAVKTIIVADFVMSLDNVLAIAAAAQQAHDDHQTLLVIFGLLVSIPFIVFGSQIVLAFLDKFPVIVWFGGALLGWIAGSMISSDSWVLEQFPSLAGQHTLACVLGAAIVVAIAYLVRRKRLEKEKN
jgi:YjbE family integral membrane protein